MAPHVKTLWKKVGNQFRNRSRSLGQHHEGPDSDKENKASSPERHRRLSLAEGIEDMAISSQSPRRKSITVLTSTIFHKRQRTSSETLRTEPALPPELIEKIASFMTQAELKKFSRVSRDCYTAAERHLYRRPFTRRFDKLLRTLIRRPYKADFILELAFGFETDFYSVKGPSYDREKVYCAILSRTRNLQQLVYQGWLQWTVNVAQPFAARHPFVMTIPTRVQTGSIPVDLLQNIPSTLRHLQFRRIYGRYQDLLDVIKRNDNLEILNLFELGNLTSVHLESIIDLPLCQSLKILRIRHLSQTPDVDHGAMISKVLPHLPNLITFTFEVASVTDDPFFSTFVRCRNIQHFKFGYCDQVTKEGLSMLVRHGELRTLEFMPALPLDLEVLNAIVAGNPHLTLLLLPRELVNEEMQKKLPSLLNGTHVRIYIKSLSHDFDLSGRQRLRPPHMQIVF